MKINNFNELKNVKMNKNVGYIKIKGIKCDNVKCGWKDFTVDASDYDSYLNRPCPVCGQNLFTKECYDNTLNLVNTYLNIFDVAEKIFPEWLLKIINKIARPKTYTAEFDENGLLK